MFDKYYRKNKREIFPWVKDWTDPHNELRHSNNIKAMDYNTWFFFHPSAYKLIFYGFNLIGMLVFGLFSILFLLSEVKILGFLTLLPLGYLVYNFTKKVVQRESIKDFTFYDLYMREFTDDPN